MWEYMYVYIMNNGDFSQTNIDFSLETFQKYAGQKYPAQQFYSHWHLM